MTIESDAAEESWGHSSRCHLRGLVQHAICTVPWGHSSRCHFGLVQNEICTGVGLCGARKFQEGALEHNCYRSQKSMKIAGFVVARMFIISSYSCIVYSLKNIKHLIIDECSKHL